MGPCPDLCIGLHIVELGGKQRSEHAQQNSHQVFKAGFIRPIEKCSVWKFCERASIQVLGKPWWCSYCPNDALNENEKKLERHRPKSNQRI